MSSLHTLNILSLLCNGHTSCENPPHCYFLARIITQRPFFVIILQMKNKIRWAVQLKLHCDISFLHLFCKFVPFIQYRKLITLQSLAFVQVPQHASLSAKRQEPTKMGYQAIWDGDQKIAGSIHTKSTFSITIIWQNYAFDHQKKVLGTFKNIHILQ